MNLVELQYMSVELMDRNERALDPVAIGEVVRLRRNKVGISQRKLAVCANTSREIVGKLEIGLPIRTSSLIRICSALGLDVIDVFKAAREV